MKKTKKSLVVLAVALASGAAWAQAYKNNCTNTGPASTEVVGEAQWLSATVASCITVDGPFQGAVLTHTDVWEGNKAALTMLSGSGVARKPGLVAVYLLKTGSGNLVMKDGKPVGWTASGTGVYTFASGEAAAFNGKTFKWSGHGTGPMTYVIETVVD